MSNCEGHWEALSALLDGELRPEEEIELWRHVDACDTCRAWLAQLESLSTGVATSIGRERAPRLLAHRVRRLQISSWRARAVGAAAVGAAFLAALVLVGRMSEGDANASRLVEDHRRFVLGETTLALLSSDPSALARGLAARLPFQVAVAEVEGAVLLGGQDCSLPGGRAAYLQYDYGGERVSVFVAPQLPPVRGAESCENVDGTILCTFVGPRETVAVVASSLSTAQAFRKAAWIVESP